MSVYHTPVLASECVELLRLQPGGVYVDATLGAGGHALALLKACPEIRLYGFDRDREAMAAARQNLADYQHQVQYIHAPFSNLRSQLALQKVKGIDGILFDLGVSSHQLDTASRGFSFDKDAPLDMRMDARQELTAAKLLNASSIQELAILFKSFGEEQQAGRIARAIETARKSAPLTTTVQLARVIESVAGKGTRDSLKTKMRVFQALRIAVNGELAELETALKDAINLLKPGARVAVLSYHSLEDRIVKNIFRDAAKGCLCPPRQIVCGCGLQPRLAILTGRPICASGAETLANPRARSAKLRVAEKLTGASNTVSTRTVQSQTSKFADPQGEQS